MHMHAHSPCVMADLHVFQRSSHNILQAVEQRPARKGSAAQGIHQVLLQPACQHLEGSNLRVGSRHNTQQVRMVQCTGQSSQQLVHGWLQKKCRHHLLLRHIKLRVLRALAQDLRFESRHRGFFLSQHA